MKLAALLDNVSDALGEPHGTVRLRARALREGGLISTGGRGRGGAEMTPRDLAHLLLGCLTYGEATAAAETVRMVGGAVVHSCKWVGHDGWHTDGDFGMRSLGPEFRQFLPSFLQHLGTEHSAADALSTLIPMIADDHQTVFLRSLEVSRNARGFGVILGLEGKGVMPSAPEDGEMGVTWYLDYGFPAPNESAVERSSALDGMFIEQLAHSLARGAGYAEA